MVDNWTYATPVCSQFEVFAVEGPNTAPYLNYYLPVKGIIPPTQLLIHRGLQTTGIDTTNNDSLITCTVLCA